MKSFGLFALVAVFALISHPAKSQDTSAVFTREYNRIFQGGTSFGYYGYGYIGDRVGFTLPLSVAYEQYVDDHISVGGFLGYSRYRYEGYNNNRYGWTFFNFGPRASFHYLHLLNDLFDQDLKAQKWDFYVSLLLNFESRSFSADSDYYADEYTDSFRMWLGPVAGFRYRFSDNFSAYFEGGRGVFGYGTLGVSYFF
jgi:hypothetical protein